jgi:hypothetical protein
MNGQKEGLVAGIELRIALNLKNHIGLYKRWC